VDELAGTLFGRWYVSAFGVAFAVLATRHLGWRRTLIYAAAAVGVGLVAENGSASDLGLPYGRYEFNPDLRGDEIWVGDVPLMVALSYTFMSYFGFASARMIVAGPWRTRSEMPVLEYLVAVLLTVWAIWIIDPVSRFGEHFFLGDLFAYEGPGFWFGLPLGSQVGFTLTSAILVGVLTWLARDEPDQPVATAMTHPRLPAVGTYVGQVLFMTITAWWVGSARDVPEAHALAGATFVIFLPVVLLVAVHWRHLTTTRSGRGPMLPTTPDRGQNEGGG
jgi:uncharacterized membrane protein